MPTRADDLALYVGAGCGYCEDVRRVARRLDVEIEERDAWGDADHLAALLEARGRRTVPVLRIAHPDGDEWMGESARIVAYLVERFGGGHTLGAWHRIASHRGTVAAMWGLLLLGGIMAEPLRSVSWTLACTLGAARSFTFAYRSGRWVHWAIGAVFTAGVLSVSLSALGWADLPWWYAAFGLVAVIAFAAWWRGRARSTD